MSAFTNLIVQATNTIPIDFQNFKTLQGSTVTSNFNLGFTNLLSSILAIIMVGALLILLGMLVYGAIGWLTSAGDSGKLESARNRMLHAVIGMLILSSVLAIFMFVQYLLGLNVFNVSSGASSTPPAEDSFREWGGRSTGSESTDTGSRTGEGTGRSN